MQVRVRSGIHEIDGVRNAFFHGELDSIEVVAESLAQLQCILFDALEQSLAVTRRILKVPLGVWPSRVIGHDVDLLLAHHIAAEILLEIDRFLIHHAQVAGVIVGLEKLAAIVNVVDIAPTAAIDRLQESMLSHILEDTVPVQRVFQVAHGAVGRSLGVQLVGQDHRRWHGHAQLPGERVVEKLVIRRPPERVVDDGCAMERGMLQQGAIKRNVVRDAIHNDRVTRAFIEVYRACFDKLRSNAIDAKRVDTLDQSAGKTVFHSKQHTDFFHSILLKRFWNSPNSSTNPHLTSVRQPRLFEGDQRTHFGAGLSQNAQGGTCFQPGSYGDFTRRGINRETSAVARKIVPRTASEARIGISIQWAIIILMPTKTSSAARP